MSVRNTRKRPRRNRLRSETGNGRLLGTISATGCTWAWRPAKGHENRWFGRMAAVGAARSRLAMEQARPSNCLTRSVRD